MVIFLLLTILIVAAALGVSVLSALTGHRKLAGAALGAGVLCCCAYLGTVAWFSSGSQASIIETGGEKRLRGFELDAHFIYSVRSIDTTGNKTRIALHVRSDARRAELTPPSLLVAIVDKQDREICRTQYDPPRVRMSPEEGHNFEVDLDCPSTSAESFLRLEHAGSFRSIHQPIHHR